MKQLIMCLLLLCILFSGCGSQAATQTEEVRTVEEEHPDRPMEIKFDPGSISQEVFENTKADVKNYIQELNGIIRRRDYGAWKDRLSDEYFDYISSLEFLKNTSEMPMLKMQGIVLNRPEDYFTHVVVPSRANARVDDIEFTSQNRVKVITIDTRNDERLRLYELEQTGNTWKIIN